MNTGTRTTANASAAGTGTGAGWRVPRGQGRPPGSSSSRRPIPGQRRPDAARLGARVRLRSQPTRGASHSAVLHKRPGRCTARAPCRQHPRAILRAGGRAVVAHPTEIARMGPRFPFGRRISRVAGPRRQARRPSIDARSGTGPGLVTALAGGGGRFGGAVPWGRRRGAGWWEPMGTLADGQRGKALKSLLISLPRVRIHLGIEGPTRSRRAKHRHGRVRGLCSANPDRARWRLLAVARVRLPGRGRCGCWPPRANLRAPTASCALLAAPVRL